MYDASEQPGWNTLTGIETELRRVGEREGFAAGELTGTIRVDRDAEAVWYEARDPESGTTFYVSPDFPGMAAPGESLVAAAAWSEALDLGAQAAS